MKERDVIALIRKHMPTAIGYMIPLMIAIGLRMALGQFIDGDARNSVSGIGYYLYKADGFGISAMVSMITAGVAYSIAGRPGVTLGLIPGFICTGIKAGFIGGIVAGSLVRYLVSAVKKYVKLPRVMQELMPIIVIPVLITAITSILMFTVVGQPFVWLQVTLTEAIPSLQSGSKFVFRAVLGEMACFGFGGPVNKTVSTFVNGLMIDGAVEPEAVKLVGSMIPPSGITISCLLARNKYTRAEKETLKAAVPMGFCTITEGVIPIAARDLIRVVLPYVRGSAVADGLLVIWGYGSPVPHGGMLSAPLFTNPIRFRPAPAIGNVITGATLSLIKKPVTEDDKGFEDLGSVMDTAGNGDGGNTRIETF